MGHAGFMSKPALGTLQFRKSYSASPATSRRGRPTPLSLKSGRLRFGLQASGGTGARSRLLSPIRRASQGPTRLKHSGDCAWLASYCACCTCCCRNRSASASSACRKRSGSEGCFRDLGGWTSSRRICQHPGLHRCHWGITTVLIRGRSDVDRVTILYQTTCDVNSAASGCLPRPWHGRRGDTVGLARLPCGSRN